MAQFSKESYRNYIEILQKLYRFCIELVHNLYRNCIETIYILYRFSIYFSIKLFVETLQISFLKNSVELSCKGSHNPFPYPSPKPYRLVTTNLHVHVPPV